MEDLNDLYLFAMVAEHGSFSGASRAIGVKKSRLSRRISALEERLGAKLLRRTTRALSLTEVGAEYLRHCQMLVEQARAAREAVERARATPSGTIRMSCPVTLSQTMLSQIIPKFMALNPEVEFDLEITNRRVDLIAEGFDISIRVRSEIEDSGLALRCFGEEELILVASPELMRGKKAERPLDLESLPALGAAGGDGRAHWTLRAPDGEVERAAPKARISADEFTLLKAATLAGLGVALMPARYCRAELASGELVRALPERWSLAPGKLHAVFPSRKGMLPAVRGFIDFMAQELTEAGGLGGALALEGCGGAEAKAQKALAGSARAAANVAGGALPLAASPMAARSGKQE